MNFILKVFMALSVIFSPSYDGRIYEYVEDNAQILSEDTIEDINTYCDLSKRSNNGYVKVITELEYSNYEVLLEDRAMAIIYFVDIDSYSIRYGQEAYKYVNRNKIDEIVQEHNEGDIDENIRSIAINVLTQLVSSYPSQEVKKEQTWYEKMQSFFKRLFSSDEVEITEGRKKSFIEKVADFLNTKDGKTLMSLLTFSITAMIMMEMIKKKMG